MKVSELRIGNWVYYNDSVLGRLTSQLSESRDFDKIKDITPIPLTETWLLNLGFKKWGKNTYYLKSIKIHKRKRGFVLAKRYKDILYVHHLQNLYQALEQEELQHENKTW